MKKLIAITLCLALFAALLGGCVSVNFGNPSIGGGYSGGTVVVGRGDQESYTFNVGEITEIRLALFCNVEVHATPSDTVALEVQPNLMEYITVDESNGVLTVRTTKNINWSDRNAPTLTVGTASLSKVLFDGAGTFTAYDVIAADSFSFDMAGAGSASAELDVKNLSVNMSGAGDIRLSGSADTANFTLAGAGRVEALTLQTREAEVTLGGVGMVRISCSEQLGIRAGGVGTVEYKGSPSVDISRGGLVTVRQINDGA